MNAVNDLNETVGEWTYPELEDANFWSPPNCAQSALHTSANLKPFRSLLRFKTPPPGTGRLTFRALVKKGPANDGEFFYPNGARGALALEEVGQIGGQLPWAPTWHVGQGGQSCHQVCGGVGKDCDSATMKTEAKNLIANVGSKHSCALPVLQDCSKLSPAGYEDGRCWAQDPVCDSGEEHCAGSAFGIQRFCACSTGSYSGRARRGAAGPADAANSAAAPAARGSLAVVHAAASLAVAATHGRQGLASALARTPLLVAGTLAALTLTASVPAAEAHNWLHTTGRARREASTTRPCRARKDSDTHAQIGPGQHVAFKWATGHNRPSYVVVVKGEDTHHMRRKAFKSWVDDYLANAPPAKQLHDQDRHKRYHGSGSTLASLHGAKDEAQAALYKKLWKEQLATTDPMYQLLNHTREPNHHVFRYHDAALKEAGDLRAEYKSDKYPMIVSAGKYEHVGERAGDWDGVAVGLPADAEPGHYVLWWHWSGYYDCVDFDRFPDKIADDLVYGKDGFKRNASGQLILNPKGEKIPNVVYNRVDHCQYQDVRRVVSKCVVTKTADECRDLVESSRMARNPKSRIGINVIPAKNPALAAFDYVNIPWQNFSCANSDVTTAKGTVTTRNAPPQLAVDWARWRKDTVAGARCKYMIVPTGDRLFQAASSTDYFTMDLKTALLKCSSARCAGIVWKAGARPMAEGEHAFQFCGESSSRVYVAAAKIWATVPSEGHDAFFKPMASWRPFAPAPPSPPSPAIRVSFQPESTKAGAYPAPPAGWKADTGKTKGTGAYGWTCDNTAGMRAGKTVQDHLSSYLSFDTVFCPDGTPKVWEIDVPNGVYSITSYHNSIHPDFPERSPGGVASCTTEGQAIKGGGGQTQMDQEPYVRTVEVTDGRYTYGKAEGETASRGCTATNYLEIQKVASGTIPDLWLPAAARTSAWWQLRLDDVAPIGLVYIKPPGMIDFESDMGRLDCRSQLLLRGTDKCLGRESGMRSSDPSAAPGMVISVADAPCSGDSCPGGTVCEVVNAPVYCAGDIGGGIRTVSDALCPYYIDCKGALGRYVRVHLPGAQRIIDAEIVVNLQQPVLPVDAFVCYAVEAKAATETRPEIKITDDPMDPAFYSTCYVREQDIEWRPPVGKAKPAKSKWQFNGQCLACDVYRRNLEPHDRAQMPAIPWAISERCEDCDGDTLQQLAAKIAPRSGGGDGGVGAGTVLGWLVFFALFFAAAGLAVRHRARIAAWAKAHVAQPPAAAGAAASTTPAAGEFANPLAEDDGGKAAPAGPARPPPPRPAAPVTAPAAPM